ncbi:hypothetical protein CsSME_00006381 [Camellia sinensis var. sinensis]
MPPVVPNSHRYDGRCQQRTRESFPFFCRYFDTVTAAEIAWQSSAMMLEGVRDQFAGSQEASRFRLLLEGPTYLMPPLTGTHGDERARAPPAREREIEGPGTLILSTHLPAPIEYTRQALELATSLMEMVQRSMHLLNLYRILIPATPDAPAEAAAGPSVPSLAAGRWRWKAPVRSRGRARATHDESGHLEPVLDDDDDADETSEDEEAVSPQSKSSEDGDDDTGLDSEGGDDAEAGSTASSDTGASNSGADGDSSESVPRKRTKKASRS